VGGGEVGVGGVLGHAGVGIHMLGQEYSHTNLELHKEAGQGYSHMEQGGVVGQGDVELGGGVHGGHRVLDGEGLVHSGVWDLGHNEEQGMGGKVLQWVLLGEVQEGDWRGEEKTLIKL